MKINPQDYIGKAIFITATNTNVGKTFASEVFLKYFAKNGLKVGYFKPIETGVIDNSPLDGLKMFELVKKLNPNFLKLTINDIVPYQFTLPASPYVAKGNTFLDIDFLIEKKEYLQTFCDVLIIEGAGGKIIADTKWKILSEDKAYNGVLQDDMYQLYAYGTKYDNCEKIYLIYPFDELIIKNSYNYFKNKELKLDILFFDVYKKEFVDKNIEL